MVVVGRLTAHIDHGIDRGRAADHLAARIVQRAAVEAFLRLGAEHPVGARIADREQIADRDVEPDPVVAPAGFEQQHAFARIGGEAVRQQAAGRAGADDDVVELAFERALPRPWLGSSSRSLRASLTAAEHGKTTRRCHAGKALLACLCDPRRAVSAIRRHPERRFRIGRSRKPSMDHARHAHACRAERSTAMLEPSRRDGLSLAACLRPVRRLLPARRKARRTTTKPLTVFAAASMRNALDDVDAAFTKATGIKVVASYAASSALAKQIAQGAPADVYVSANIKWMDFLAQQKLIKPATRINLLGNSLVLIAPAASKLDQCRHRQGLRYRQARRLRPHRGRRHQGGAGRALCQGGAAMARRLDGGGAEAGAGRERARDARLCGARRDAARHRLFDRRQDRAEGEDHWPLPGSLASADHLSGGGTLRDSKNAAAPAICSSCAASRRRKSSRDTASIS